jgi:hypothetical protein
MAVKINKRRIEKTGIGFISVLLVFSIIGYIFSTVATMHIHELPDGRFIVHSHPYDPDTEDGGKSKHTHTRKEYTIIGILNYLVITIIFFFAYATFVVRNRLFTLIGRDFSLLSFIRFLSRSWRSPPLASDY